MGWGDCQRQEKAKETVNVTLPIHFKASENSFQIFRKAFTSMEKQMDWCLEEIKAIKEVKITDLGDLDRIEAFELRKRFLFITLRKLAVKGFGTSKVRRIVWPFLLNVEDDDECINKYTNDEMYVNIRYDGESEPSEDASDWEMVDPSIHEEKNTKYHAYWDIVRKDVNRSLHNFDIVEEIPQIQRNVLRRRLERVIDAILIKNASNEVHYIQGLHDVCSTALLVLEEALAFKVVDKLVQSHLKDMLRSTLGTVVTTLDALFPLVGLVSSKLQRFLIRSSVRPFFALSWMITWFAHDLKHFENVCRVYDFLIASHPLMVLYLCASVILKKEQQVLKIDCEFAAVHHFFQDVEPIEDMDDLLHFTLTVFQSFPPKYLLAVSGLTCRLPIDSPVLREDMQPQHTPKYTESKWFYAGTVVFIAIAVYYASTVYQKIPLESI